MIFWRIVDDKVLPVGEVDTLGFEESEGMRIPDEYLEEQEFVIMRGCHGIGDYGIISAMPRLLKKKYPNCGVFVPSNNLYQKLWGKDNKVVESIFKNNPNVFTLSFHGQKNYPFRKENSDLDLGFDDFTNYVFYLKKLKEIIPRVIDNFQPDFIYYLAGVDVLKNDKLGRLSLTIKGCLERDRFILKNCKKNNIPVQVSMGGGYSINIEEIIEAHSNTFRLAQEIYF